MRDGIDPDTMLSQAERFVAIVMALGADCAEAYVTAGTSVSVDVEKDVVTYTTGNAEAGIGVRLVKDGRLGFAYTSDADKLEEAAQGALSLSRLSPRLGYVVPAGGGSYTPVEGLFDADLVTMEPGEAVNMAGEMVDAARAVHEGASVAGAGVNFGHGAVAIANSEGMAIASLGTSMSAMAYVVLKDASVSTGFEFDVRRTKGVDAAEVGTSAARMALDAQGAEPLEKGGEMAVVFRPTAIAELLENTVVPSLIGDAAQRGESAFTGRDGELVAIESLSIIDDPRMPGGLNSGRADDEGVPVQRNVLIDRGVLKGFLYDTFTANEYGVETTASAVRGGGAGWKSQPEASVTNLVLEAPSAGSLDDLISQIDRGILVHDVMGAHTANRSTLDFSVNSTMPYEIRNGEVLGVRNPVMLGGNVGKVLEAILGSGGEGRQCPGSMSPSNIFIPWLAADGITVTP
jgi:PmbA protein